jgi:hypothetical protein
VNQNKKPKVKIAKNKIFILFKGCLSYYFFKLIHYIHNLREIFY